MTTSAGLTGDRQKLCSSPEPLFSPHLAQKLDDRRIKLSPNLTKIRRHDHKGLVNMSMEGIDESLHGLGGIDEFPSKERGFLKNAKTLI